LSEAERLGRAHHICPVVPLRNLVAFPHTILPLHIGRKKSVNALAVEDVAGGRKPIFLVAQKNNDPDPSPEAVYRMGTLATIMQWMSFDDGSVKVLLECKERGRILRFVETTDYLEAEVEPVVETTPDSTGAIEVLVRSTAARFTQYVRANKQISPEASHIVTQVRDASELADLVASHLAIETASKQELLETTSVLGRLQAILSFMGNDLHVPQAAKGDQSPASKLDTHADTRLRKLHVTQYAGRYSASSQDLAYPSWDQVETSIRRLDQFQWPFVWLLLGEGADWGAMEEEGYLNIMGGNGIYSVDGATPFDGRKRLSAPRHSREKRVDVWLSDQGFSTAEVFVCYELETVLRVAKYFCGHGRLDPSVEWLTASATGVWDVF